MKELLKKLKREIEQELLRIRNELKNIDKNSNEHNYFLLINREGFLKQDLEILKKSLYEESIEVLLRHLRIDSEDTKATEDDVLKIGKHYMKKEQFSKAKDLYKKVLNNNVFKIDLVSKNTINRIINNDDSSNKLLRKGLNIAEEGFNEYKKRNYEKALEYWELGAKNNLAISQSNIGIVYLGLDKLEIDDFETDFNKGVELLSRAAKQGNEKATLLLEMIEDKKEIIMKTITNIREGK